eukprot:jgi/Mesen1/10003/ME000722S09288
MLKGNPITSISVSPSFIPTSNCNTNPKPGSNINPTQNRNPTPDPIASKHQDENFRGSDTVPLAASLGQLGATSLSAARFLDRSKAVNGQAEATAAAAGVRPSTPLLAGVVQVARGAPPEAPAGGADASAWPASCCCCCAAEGGGGDHARAKPVLIKASSNVQRSADLLRKCATCQLWQPMRAKHCHDCDRCVLKFDHHCFWVGTCVGQRNHARFWWYLLLETLLSLWTLAVAFSSLDWKSRQKWWLERNLLILAAGVVLLCLTLFLLILLLFHSYLVVTNQTTYELTRRKRISYLKALRLSCSVLESDLKAVSQHNP